MKRLNWMLAALVIGAFLLQACGAVTTVESGSAVSEAGKSAAAESLPAVAVEDRASRARDDKSDADVAASAITEVQALQLAEGTTVTVSEATNCRTGPGIAYDLVVIVEAGQAVEVGATYPFGPYVVVNNPNGHNSCWLWLEYADRSDFGGLDLPEAVKPPEPTEAPEAFEWSGYWTAWVEGTAYTFYVYVDGSHLTGEFIDGYGNSVILNGQMDASGRTVQGTYAWAGSSSYFKMQAKNYEGSLFIGQWGPSLGEFCGARDTLPQPSPCLGP